MTEQELIEWYQVSRALARLRWRVLNGKPVQSMFSIKPANDTDEFYNAISQFDCSPRLY